MRWRRGRCSATGGGWSIVEEADAFVSEHRAELEDYVARPANGVLVLDVKTWAANTRLAKAVAVSGRTIECVAPRSGN